jgi:hypothetical protein
MTNDRRRSLSSSSFSSFASEARSLPLPHIEDDPHGAPAPDPAAALLSLAARSHLRAPSTEKNIADSRWDKRYQELVDYKAKHGVRFDSKADTHCTCDYFVDSTSAFVDTQDCHVPQRYAETPSLVDG